MLVTDLNTITANLGRDHQDYHYWELNPSRNLNLTSSTIRPQTLNTSLSLFYLQYYLF